MECLNCFMCNHQNRSGSFKQSFSIGFQMNLLLIFFYCNLSDIYLLFWFSFDRNHAILPRFDFIIFSNQLIEKTLERWYTFYIQSFKFVIKLYFKLTCYLGSSMETINGWWLRTWCALMKENRGIVGEKKIRFVTALGLLECLKQIKITEIAPYLRT